MGKRADKSRKFKSQPMSVDDRIDNLIKSSQVLLNRVHTTIVRLSNRIRLDKFTGFIDLTKEPDLKYTQAEQDCSICYTKRHNVILRCSHEICLPCARRWEKFGRGCPICRCAMVIDK